MIIPFDMLVMPITIITDSKADYEKFCSPKINSVDGGVLCDAIDKVFKKYNKNRNVDVIPAYVFYDCADYFNRDVSDDLCVQLDDWADAFNGTRKPFDITKHFFHSSGGKFPFEENIEPKFSCSTIDEGTPHLFSFLMPILIRGKSEKDLDLFIDRYFEDDSDESFELIEKLVEPNLRKVLGISEETLINLFDPEFDDLETIKLIIEDTESVIEFHNEQLKPENKHLLN